MHTQRRPGSQPELRIGDSGDGLVSHDALQAYMHDISALPLLDKADEQRWAQIYSEARDRMQQIVDDFPEVFIHRLKQLINSPEDTRLSEYIDVKYSEEENFGELEGSRESYLRIIQCILDDADDLVAAILRGEHRRKDFHHPSGYNTGLSALLYSKLRKFGRVRFTPHFYSDCVDFFISGVWQCEDGRLSATAQQELRQKMQQARQRSQEAMKALVEGNLRLVISIVKGYNINRMQLSDLIQEGNIGLMRAVELFEYQRGHRFSTYACYWIRQAVSYALNVGSRTIKIPPHVLHQLSKIRHAEQELLLRNGEMPSPELLAAELQLPVPRIRALQRMAMQPISLQSIGNGERDWSEMLSSSGKDDASYHSASENLKSYLNSVLEELPEREQEILNRRFGLNGRQTETLEQIAASFGLSSERIRQLEGAALHKLRRWTRG